MGKMLESGRSRILFALCVAFIVIGLAALFILLRMERGTSSNAAQHSTTMNVSANSPTEDEPSSSPSTTDFTPSPNPTVPITDGTASPDEEKAAEDDSNSEAPTTLQPIDDGTIEEYTTIITPTANPLTETDETGDNSDSMPTPLSPLEEITSSSQSQHIPQCDFPVDFAVKCDAMPPSGKAPTGVIDAKGVDVRLIEVTLNLTIASKETDQLEGSVELLLEVLHHKGTSAASDQPSTITLAADRQIQFTAGTKFSLWHCEDGKLICVKELQRGSGTVGLVLSEKLEAGSHLRLRVENYASVDVAGNPSLLVQRPLRWERESKAWMLGTNFEDGRQRGTEASPTASLFPSPHQPDARGKAVFKLCLQHPAEGTQARSNAGKRNVNHGTSQTTTCFEETPLISVDQFAFLAFDNMKVIPSPVLPAGEIEVETLVGKHLNVDDVSWIIAEAIKSLRIMSMLTSQVLPIRQLTVAAVPLKRLDATSSLGLIYLKEAWLDYSRYQFTHSVLALQVVRQWISNAVSFCDPCIEDGLADYLEWVVSSEVNKSSATDVMERFRKARNRVMGSVEPTRLRVFDPSMLSTKDVNSTCGDRMAVILFMLESAFGRESITKQFLPLVVSRFAWAPKCIPTRLLPPLFLEAVGSSEAKRVFESFILSDGSNPPVVVQLHLHSNRSLTVTQKQQQSAPLSIPVEVVDEARRVLRLVLHDSWQQVHKPANYIVASPNSYVRHLYNVGDCLPNVGLSSRQISTEHSPIKVENYEKLANCFTANGENSCAATENYPLKAAVDDLCWALMEDQLGSDETAALGAQGQWVALFKTLSQKKDLLHGDCHCCMQGVELATATAQCRWTWRDKCSRIKILS